MTVDVANSLYVVCLAVGGLLLLISIVLDDYLDRSLDALRIRFEIGGASFVQLLFAFLPVSASAGLSAPSSSMSVWGHPLCSAWRRA